MTSKDNRIYGLVLAGGKSTRMGQDKSLINWHGKEQQYHIADLLRSVCDEAFISCREEQLPGIDKNYKTIADSVTGKGPVAGILSAMEANNDAPWLVVACDLPLLDKATLQHLISNRDATRVATTYKSPHDGLPEPLITIWEPRAKKVLYEFKDRGYDCPRKALINSDTLILDPLNPEALINTNTPEEAEKVRQILNTRLKTAS